MNRMTKEERAAAKAEKNALREFRQYPYLLAMKPKERYIFHSDYFDVDGQVGTVLSFFHVDGKITAHIADLFKLNIHF